MTKLKKNPLIRGGVLAVVAAVIGAMACFGTDSQRCVHLDFGSVYITVLLAQLGTGAAFGLLALAALALHVVLIRRFSKPRSDWTVPTPEGDVDIGELVRKVSTPVVVTAAVVVAAAMGYLASRHWEDVLKLLNQTSFGRGEPILGKDIGFYLFELPALQFTQQWLVYLTGLCVALSGGVYFARGAIVMKGRLPEMSRQVRGHLLFALAPVLLVIAWGYRLEMFETLFSKRGIAYGATYTDVVANLNVYRVMIVACVVVALFLLYSVWAKVEGRAAVLRPAVALAGVFALYLLGTFVLPTVVQRLVVNPNELEKEREYLEHAIAGTRAAYSLDQVEVKEFPATDELTRKQLAENSPTIDNIKIWDHRPLRETYKQLQVIRLYYDFPNISVDRYRIGDNYWQVMLSARELVHAQLPQQSQTWVNRHLQYTHGYGVCLSPVNTSLAEGLPDLWLKDIPPEARHPDIAVKRPEVYYGLESDDYVLVKTSTQEFDYPRGKDNVYTTYQGKGGVGVGSFFRRMLFAIRFADMNLLFTRYLKPESRILFNRSIQQRVATVAPFLMLDQEPYITVVDGRMYWVQDAYTISYRYPYSQPTPLGRRKRINYIRNSVKVVVDAYDGSLRLFVWDERDPVVQTYAKMFPTLFKGRDEMEPQLRAHTRYPKDLFTIQAAMYESFHMTDPRVFYNQEDKWDIAHELAEKTGPRPVVQPRQRGVTAQQVTAVQSRMPPYYMIMKLPGERDAEFLLMLPFTPTNKHNLVGWMTARCDGDNYGKLLVYAFPKKKLIFGPMQVEARIDQDSAISKWITLRNQQGSTVIRGDLLVIPIDRSILYVEPIYLQSTQTLLPELKQVIVAFGKRLAMRPTLAQALEAVFGVADEPGRVASWPQADGKSPPTMPQPTGPSLAPGTAAASDLAAVALQRYEEAQRKLAAGDWAGYGEQQKALRQALQRLAEQIKPRISRPPTKTPAELGQQQP